MMIRSESPDRAIPPYTMRLSLSILEHLGLNLYSNIPAVLSEVVANSWDADATEVSINLDETERTIEITDNGIGMTMQDLNDRFLYVGYRRRDMGPPTTRLGRHVMGRKGIGKLSLFAIAKTIRLETAKDGERSGLVLRADDIRNQIKSIEGEYHPDPVNSTEVSITVGTRIVLSDLKIRPTQATLTGLRRRLARRFSIIGPDNNFHVLVNNDEILVTERDFYPKIEYLWSLGDVDDTYEKLCENAKKRHKLTGTVDLDNGWIVTGWVGTVDEQKSIEEETNVIPVLAWGKLIHEDLLSAIKPAGLFAKYLMGEIHANFVDEDGSDDIATSDRQSLKETDPRFVALAEYLDKEVLRQVGNLWSGWRHDDALDKARKNPVVEEWYSSLRADAKTFAKQLFGKIGNMPLESEADRLELYKYGILAFEKLRLRDLLSEIDNLDSATQLDLIGRVFANIDELEAAQYGEIAMSRMRVIQSFADVVDTNKKERVIQEHLFDHLWLLDSSWERASTNARIEQSVSKEFEKIDAGLSDGEKAGRVDIRYRTAAGKNIIIELKRYSVDVSTGNLVSQITKYRRALQKCLETQFPGQPQMIECVAVLGRPPNDLSPLEVEQTLAGISTRVVTYDTLIANALDSYKEYIDSNAEVSRLANLIERLEIRGKNAIDGN